MILSDFLTKQKKVSVIGLGYVGLPLALALGKKFSVIGFDINQERLEMMRRGEDPSKELSLESFVGKDIFFTHKKEDLREADFYIVAVPTPIDSHKNPDLRMLHLASETVGTVIKEGNYVVFESTVYPGCTEEDCIPIIERLSGLKRGVDFKVGYSPERISPGSEYTLENILKIVSAIDEDSLVLISEIYNEIIDAGIYKASSIKVAEAAKIIENTQRDLNIALMNELAIIFDQMGIDTQEVLQAAGTKWNFLKFYPGLVGGHCIGVDPYYLLHKAKQLGLKPQVINSGRRINDEMPGYIAKKLVQALIKKRKNPGQSKVLVMGITFKENISDIRNSKVADLVKELMQFSVNVHLTDPHASPNDVAHEYGLSMVDQVSTNYDAVIVAVKHEEYKDLDLSYFKSVMNGAPILYDLKGLLAEVPKEGNLDYWRL